MSKLRFTAEDFKTLCGCEDRYRDDLDTDEIEMVERKVLAAEIANARLAEMLAAAPVVYRNQRRTAPKVHAVYWTEYENDLTLDGPQTARARLVEIERIENGNVEAHRNRTAG